MGRFRLLLLLALLSAWVTCGVARDNDAPRDTSATAPQERVAWMIPAPPAGPGTVEHSDTDAAPTQPQPGLLPGHRFGFSAGQSLPHEATAGALPSGASGGESNRAARRTAILEQRWSTQPNANSRRRHLEW